MLSEFGRYLILKKIAVGGMAEIFLARRVSLGQFSKFVVLKRLSPEYQGKRSFERLFMNEARLTGRLSHPNIVQLHDIGQVDGSFFMAMEYIHGISSAEMMSRAAQRRTPVPLGVALGITLSTAKALAYCGQALSHEGEALDLLHHDVSPHNIQVRFDGVVKLLDFGVATQSLHQEGNSRRGKFAYMSPEAFHRKHLDQRSDLFSLGVVLYELTMGRRLFKGRTQQETKQKAEACNIPAPRSIHPQFPEELEVIILKALEVNREQRFKTFDEFILSLETLRDELSIDCSDSRIARYLHDLYGDEIERRAMQLQSLAARANVIGADPLDEINTLNAREQAPVNLTNIPMGGLPNAESLATPVKTPLSAISGNPLYENDYLEDELIEEIGEEKTPPPQEGAKPGLPPQFTLIGQREGDWDERSPSLDQRPSRGARIVWIALIFLALGGGFFFGQNQIASTTQQQEKTRFNITSSPEGATVTVGGVRWGVTPIKNLEREISTPQVTIEISKPRYDTQASVLNVASGDSVRVHINLPRKTQ